MTPVTEEQAMADVRAAVRRFKAAQKRLEQAHADLRETLREASAAGVKQARLVELTGYTREHVRRLLRPDDHDGGASPDMPKGRPA